MGDRPGHPELEASWDWDAEQRSAPCAVEQKQTVSAEAPLPLHGRVRFEVDGQERDETVNVRERAHAFEFRLPSSRPRWSSIPATSS